MAALPLISFSMPLVFPSLGDASDPTPEAIPTIRTASIGRCSVYGCRFLPVSSPDATASTHCLFPCSYYFAPGGDATNPTPEASPAAKAASTGRCSVDSGRSQSVSLPDSTASTDSFFHTPAILPLVVRRTQPPGPSRPRKLAHSLLLTL